MTSLIALLIVIPAVVIACHCCPTPASDGRIGIQKIPCQNCCPEISQTVRDCGTLQEKQDFTVPQDILKIAPVLNDLTNLNHQIQEVKSIRILDSSPPPLSFSLSTILRI